MWNFSKRILFFLLVGVILLPYGLYAQTTATGSRSVAPNAVPISDSNGRIDPRYISAGLDYIDRYSDLTAAVTAIGGTVKTLVIASPTSITASTTIPSTLTLRFERNGSVTLGAYNLTINSRFSDQAVSDCFIQNSSGVVSFATGAVDQISPALWLGWGTTGTATSQALQAAINSLSTACQVKIPKGTFTFDPAITINLAASTKIVGAGGQETILVYSGSGVFISGTTSRFIEIHNLKLELAGAADGAIALDFLGDWFLNLVGCTINGPTPATGPNTIGIRMRGKGSAPTSGAYFSNLSRLLITRFGSGILYNVDSGSPSYANVNSVRESYLSLNGIGIKVTKANELNLYNTSIEGNTSDGVYLDDADYFLMLGGTLEGNTGYGINATANCSDRVSVVGVNINSNTAGSINTANKPNLSNFFPGNFVTEVLSSTTGNMYPKTGYTLQSRDIWESLSPGNGGTASISNKTGIVTLGALSGGQTATINLPDASVVGTGQRVFILTIGSGSGVYTVTPVNATIQGASSMAIQGQYDGALLELYKIGSSYVWAVVRKNLSRVSGTPTQNAVVYGQEYLDSSTGKFYKSVAIGTGASDWVAIN